MPRKPLDIGALAYLLSAKVMYRELHLLVVGLSSHADRNDAETLKFLNMLIVRFKRLFPASVSFATNVIVDYVCCAARHEFSNNKLPDGAKLLNVMASVRNQNDTLFRVLCAGLMANKYRSFSRYKATMKTFECITVFHYGHNRKRHTVVRFYNSVITRHMICVIILLKPAQIPWRAVLSY